MNHDDLWTCRECGKIYSVPSLARDCEAKDTKKQVKVKSA